MTLTIYDSHQILEHSNTSTIFAVPRRVGVARESVYSKEQFEEVLHAPAFATNQKSKEYAETLINEPAFRLLSDFLRFQGPFIVIGAFGRENYSTGPTTYPDKIAGLAVETFKAGSRKEGDQADATFILHGAKILHGREMLLLTRAFGGNDNPNEAGENYAVSPQDRKVYMISLRTFKTNLTRFMVGIDHNVEMNRLLMATDKQAFGRDFFKRTREITQDSKASLSAIIRIAAHFSAFNNSKAAGYRELITLWDGLGDDQAKIEVRDDGSADIIYLSLDRARY